MDHKHLTFLLRAHGTFNGRIFNVPGMYFMGNKDAYDAIHALDGHIDWPSAQNEIVESLQKVYREKHFDGWDWKSIRLKHLR